MTTSHPGKRVLLIDDNIVTQETMSMALAAGGYRVATASNGADALERLRGYERPSLILLDLSMPVMDGCAFCRQRQQDPALAAIPVVVLSAAGDVAEKALSLGAQAFLRKPVDLVDLLDTVRRHCL
jgi:two-component system response regulator MprA